MLKSNRKSQMTNYKNLKIIKFEIINKNTSDTLESINITYVNKSSLKNIILNF